MKTYQDLLEVGEEKKARTDFVYSLVHTYRNSDAYRDADTAYQYAAHKNVTISQYRKLLYTVSGKAVPDNYSANWKMPSNFFSRFVTQEVQYLLGNGISWSKEDTAVKLGNNFDIRLQKLAKDALIGGVAYGFWNYDHMERFKATEFVPLYDEENGALMAGVRWWQIAANKPLRATLYEPDGYTEYMRKNGETVILKEKRPYVQKTWTTEADGTEIYDFENYPSFPIVPLWGNPYKQSELVGLREQIDCYDLIKSGFANDLDDASQIYWVIQNAGGMSEIDLAKFIDRMKTVKAAIVEDDGAKAEAHTIEVPYQSREVYLNLLRADLYEDAMALDTKNIANGATTATQIKAAYEPLKGKTDDFEYGIHEFLEKILAIAGIEKESATFTRSTMINTLEEIQGVMQAATALPEDYVTRKVLTILGDGDLADELIGEMHTDEVDRFRGEENETGEEEGEEE